MKAENKDFPRKSFTSKMLLFIQIIPVWFFSGGFGGQMTFEELFEAVFV